MRASYWADAPSWWTMWSPRDGWVAGERGKCAKGGFSRWGEGVYFRGTATRAGCARTRRSTLHAAAPLCRDSVGARPDMGNFIGRACVIF